MPQPQSCPLIPETTSRLHASQEIPMRQLLSRLVSAFGSTNTARSARRAPRRANLQLECLESREVPSVAPLLMAAPVNVTVHAAPAAPATTDATSLVLQLQQSGQLAKPTGPTMLYLNFDGWTNTPYSSTIGTSNLGALHGLRAGHPIHPVSDCRGLRPLQRGSAAGYRERELFKREGRQHDLRRRIQGERRHAWPVCRLAQSTDGHRPPVQHGSV